MRIQSVRQASRNGGRADVVSDVAGEIRGPQAKGAESLRKNVTGVLAGEKER